MNENEDNLEDLFGKRFSNDEAPVSPRVWANIEKTLPKDTGNGGAWYTRKLFLFSAFGSLLIGCLALLVLLPNKSNVELSNHSINSLNNNHTKDSIENTSTLKQNSSTINNPSLRNNTTAAAQIDDKDEKITTVINSNEQKSDPVNTSELKSSDANNLSNGVISNFENKKKQVSQSSDVYSKSNKDFVSNKKLDNNAEHVKASSFNSITNKIENNNSTDNSISNKSITDNSTNVTIGKSPITPKNKGVDIGTKTETSPIDPQLTTTDLNTTTNVTNKSIPENSNNLNNTIETGNSDLINATNKELTKVSKNDADKSTSIKRDNDTKEFLNGQDHQRADSSKDNTDGSTDLVHLANLNDTLKNNLDALSPIKNSNDTLAKTEEDPMFLVTNTPPMLAKDSVILEKVDSIPSMPDSVNNALPEKKEDVLKRSRWSVDLLLTPAITGASTKLINNDSSATAVVEDKNRNDKNSFDFSIGGLVNYSLLPRLTISTGIIYSRYSEKNKLENTISYDSNFTKEVFYKDSITVFDTVTLQNITIPHDTSKFVKLTEPISKKYSSEKIDRYTYFSLPLSFTYTIIDKAKFSIAASLGVRINMLLNGVTYIRNSINTDFVVESSGYNKVTLSYMASMGLEYKIRPKLSILAQPTMNHNIGSVFNKSANFSQKPYSIGLNVGLRIKF